MGELDTTGSFEEFVLLAVVKLADAGLLSKAETTSSVGKGRPAYALAVSGDAVLNELHGAGDVGSYAEALAG